MASNKENQQKDLIKMSRMDALWNFGVPATITQIKNIIKMKIAGEESKRWPIWLIGESGIGKNHLQEQVCKELGIEYLWFPCKGLAPEDIRGFPMPVRKLNGDGKTKEEYVADAQGLVSLMYDYYHREPVYKFQQLEYLMKAFTPGWKGIIHFDEFAQATKEVQEILYMLFYDRRLDDRHLSDDALIISSMNPPQVNDYMLAKIGKAAQDRPSIFKIEATAKEWIQWAKQSGIHDTLISFVTEHPTVYDRNKGRALHRFSDDLKMFGDLDPTNIPVELKIIAHSDIDIESADKFVKYVKEVFEISGVQLLQGDKSMFAKLKKMLKSDAKSVHLYRVQQEMLRAMEEPETYLKDVWKKNSGDAAKAWDEVSDKVVDYIKLLQDGDMDSAVGLLKEITKMNLVDLEDRINKILKLKENRDLYKEVLRCLSIQVNTKQTESDDPLTDPTLAAKANP